MSKVAILGAGPSGLLAAYAVERSGHEPVIISNGHGATVDRSMFLMDKIPGLNSHNEDFALEVEVRGTAEGYARRVYRDPTAPVSLDTFAAGSYIVWGLQETYAKLWNMYGSSAERRSVTPYDIAELLSNYELVISTLYSPELCIDADHKFDKVDTFIAQQVVTEEPDRISTMIYNGSDEWQEGVAQTAIWNWYRYSAIRGVETWEYTHLIPGQMSIGKKPISNTCDCWQRAPSSFDRPQQLHRVGRFAKWERGVMNHHAFQDTVAILSTEGMGRSV